MKITQVLHEAEIRAKKQSKRIIKENANPSEADVKKYFNIDGSIEFTQDGINVEGDVVSKQSGSSKIDKIPFKFNTVSGTFDVQDFNKLKTLENFPRQCTVIDISGNSAMTEFIDGADIVCDKLLADWSGLVTLRGAPVARIYSFDGSRNLESTEGLPMSKIEAINLKDCNKLKYIRELSEPISSTPTEKSWVPYNENMPMVGLILSSKNNNKLNLQLSNEPPKNLKQIIQDFSGRGLGAAMELIRALRDKGFNGNARLR